MLLFDGHSRLKCTANIKSNMIQVKPTYVPRDPFTFMVSGGLDSIVAAHWLKFQYRKDFTLIHFNHAVQSINNDMAAAVYQFAEDFDFEARFFERDLCFTDTSENGMRAWRHVMLEQFGGAFISGHHLNDAVESYLDNCFKGHPEHRPISWFTQFKGFSIHHPFLLTTKRDFHEYALRNDLVKYIVDDPTNHDSSNNRSWMRNKLIPILDERMIGLEKVVKKKFYSK